MPPLNKYYHHHQGIKLAYRINVPREALEGREGVLVFNYGLLCSNEHWNKQVPFFHSHGFPMVLHDYRAHHDSSGDWDLESCSFKNMALDILALLSHLKVRSCVLLGHSMGVSICLEMAKIRGEMVSKMVLISGLILPPQDTMFHSNIVDMALPGIRFGLKTFPRSFRFLWQHAHLNPLVRKAILHLGLNPERVPDSLVKLYVQRIGELDPRLFLKLFEEIRAHDMITRLESLDIPALIIGGDRDKVVPNHLQRIFHRYLPDSQLYIVKEGGHVPQWEFPDSVNERILKFLGPAP